MSGFVTSVLQESGAQHPVHVLVGGGNVLRNDLTPKPLRLLLVFVSPNTTDPGGYHFLLTYLLFHSPTLPLNALPVILPLGKFLALNKTPFMLLISALNLFTASSFVSANPSASRLGY